MSKKHQFKILSIDGGGIRGIIPCTILSFIENQVGTLSSTFDLMAGTSTGGIIALGLATPDEDGNNAFDANAMLDLYVKHGKDIFKARESDMWNSVLKISDLAGEMSQLPYDAESLEKVLLRKFGDIRLKQSLTDLLITTYEINKEKTFYFLSRLARVKEEENFELREIARSTSAAPTYFKPAIVKWKTEKEAFIDGGVFANNPSVLAYGEAKELWKRKGQLAFEPDVLPDDKDLPFFMLSLSTGHCPQYISAYDAEKWRTAQWIKPMLTNIFMNSVASSTHFTMQHLLPKYMDGTSRYERLDIQIPPQNQEMDDASAQNIADLQEIAQNYIKDNKDKLMTICDYLNA